MISDDDVVVDAEADADAAPEAAAEAQPPQANRTDPVEPAEAEAAAVVDRKRSPLVVTAVLVTLLVAALAVALLQASRASDLADDRDALDAAAGDRQAATLVAAQFAEVFFTYDFSQGPSSNDAMLALVTTEYAEQFEEQNVPGLEDVFGAAALVSTGVAQEVYVGEVDGDEAHGLARVDVETNFQGVETTQADVTLSIDLEREDGEWRVSAVRLVERHLETPDGQLLTDPADPTATTATTAPAG